MRLYGSVTNRIVEQSSQTDTLPAVGDGATEYRWSDREAYTVVAVGGTAKRPVVTIQRDKAILVERRDGHDGAHEYRYEPDPSGTVHRVERRTRGGQTAWCIVTPDRYEPGRTNVGNKVVFGHRSHYRDPSL
jgi:hypothetical protein